MATKIVLVLDETLDEEQIRLLKQMLLTDAFYEYFTSRQGDYVSRRYEKMTEAFRERKRIEVSKKVSIAQALHRCAFGVQVETFVGPCKKCGAPGMADAFYDAHPGDDPRRCDECGML